MFYINRKLVNPASTLTSRILTCNFPRFGNLNCQFRVSNNVINCWAARSVVTVVGACTRRICIIVDDSCYLHLI